MWDVVIGLVREILLRQEIPSKEEIFSLVKELAIDEVRAAFIREALEAQVSDLVNKANDTLDAFTPSGDLPSLGGGGISIEEVETLDPSSESPSAADNPQPSEDTP